MITRLCSAIRDGVGIAKDHSGREIGRWQNFRKISDHRGLHLGGSDAIGVSIVMGDSTKKSADAHTGEHPWVLLNVGKEARVVPRVICHGDS